MTSIKRKTIKGLGWSFTDNFFSSGITFIVGIVLARILTDQEYGLIGIISIFIAVFNSIVDSGFSSALIRKKDCRDIDFNTVFYFNLTLSFLLFGILYLIAPAISIFFNQSELTLLTRVMSGIVVINAFAIIQRTILVKNIDFKTQTKVSLVSSIISGVAGIGVALYGFGVWSLVTQQIIRQLLNTILLWIFNTWRPALRFSWQSFRELFNFGWKLLVSGLLATIWQEVYQVVIGKFYSAATLGQYTRAKGFTDIFSSNITTVVQRVSYPVLSSIQDEKERLKQAYKKIIKSTMLITFVSIFGLAAIAKPMVLVLIGEKWLPAVEFLQIICFSAMLYPLHAINLNMLNVQGRSDLYLKLEIIKKIIAIVPLSLGIFINIRWMLWGSVLTGIISYFLNSYYSGKYLNYKVGEQILDILPSFCIASIMAIVLWFLSFSHLSPFIILPIQLIIGIIITFVLCETTKLAEYIEMKKIILSYLFNQKKYEF